MLEGLEDQTNDEYVERVNVRDPNECGLRIGRVEEGLKSEIHEISWMWLFTMAVYPRTTTHRHTVPVSRARLASHRRMKRARQYA